MQLYYFILKAGLQIVPDTDGQEMADEVAARQHAITVARQLMQHREADTRSWRIQVCDDYLRPLFDVQFVEADEAIDQRPSAVQLNTMPALLPFSAALEINSSHIAGGSSDA